MSKIQLKFWLNSNSLLWLQAIPVYKPSPSQLPPPLQHTHTPLLNTVYTHTHLDVDIEGSRTGSIAAGQRIQEVDAVSVVLLQDGHVEVGLLSRRSSRRVDHHERTCSPAEEKKN